MGRMGLLKRLLGDTRVYQAISHAYEESWRHRNMRYNPSQFARCGEHVQIDPRVYISHPNRVVIGDWTTIQSQTAFHTMGGLHLGSYVGIGFRVMMLTFQHRYRNARTIPYDDGVFLQPVLVRDYAWIGWGSLVLPGVEIGEGAIVGMGSVVTQDVPPLAIVIGNPANVVGSRSPEHFARCKEEGRVNPHRILEVYGRFDEIIPLMTRKRYERELREMGMIE